MTFYYELDGANERIRLRFLDDSGSEYGPRDINWRESRQRVAPDGWIVEPDCKKEAGVAATDMWNNGNQLVALQMLRDIASGDVVEGIPGN